MSDPEHDISRELTKKDQLLESYRLALMAMNLAELLESGGQALDSVDIHSIRDPNLLACIPLDTTIRRMSTRNFAQLNLNFNDSLPDKESRQPTTTFCAEFVFCDNPASKNEPVDVVVLSRSKERPSSFTVTLTQDFGEPIELADIEGTYIGRVIGALVSPGALVDSSLYAKPELPAAREIIEFALAERAQDTPRNLEQAKDSKAFGGVSMRTYLSPSSFIPGSIEVTRVDGDIVVVELRRSIQNDLIIIDGEPKEVIRDVVTVVDLSPGTTGVSHFISHGPDKPSKSFEPDRSDIAMLREFMHHAAPQGLKELLLGDASDADLDFLRGDNTYPAPDVSDQDGFDSPDSSA